MIPFPWYDELEDHEDRLDPEFTRGKLRVIAFPSSSSDELEIRLDFELNDDELALMEDECESLDELPILSSFRFDNELESHIIHDFAVGKVVERQPQPAAHECFRRLDERIVVR